MACYINVFKRPDLVVPATKLATTLQTHVDAVAALDHAKSRLEALPRRLYSNMLDRCKLFAAAVNKTPEGGDFDLELSKLTYEQLAFCSISFDNKRLQWVPGWFEAVHIQDYMETRSVSCDRKDIFSQLERLPGCGIFQNICFRAKSAKTKQMEKKKKKNGNEDEDELMDDKGKNGKEDELMDDKGKNGKEDDDELRDERNENEDDDELKNETNENEDELMDPRPPLIENDTSPCRPPTRENVEQHLGDKIASVLPENNTVSEKVTTRYPVWMLNFEVLDGITSIQMSHEPDWLHNLFPGTGGGVSVDTLYSILSPTLREAVEKSDLRQWELRQGLNNLTNCAWLTPTLNIRVGWVASYYEALHGFQLPEWIPPTTNTNPY